MAKAERSAGFLIYRRVPRDTSSSASASRQYLLLDYGRYWDFPKGHVERGETDIEAAIRELKEETGLVDVTIDPDYSREIKYFFRDRKAGLVSKSVIFFLAGIESGDVTISDEHVGFAFLPYSEALKRLSYANARELLRSAETHLMQNDRFEARPSE